MLIIDTFHGYTTEEVKSRLKHSKTNHITIPGGITSMLQLLDICNNHPFKAALKQLHTEWMASGNHPLKPTGKLNDPKFNNCVNG
jgi:hypothetical protein